MISKRIMWSALGVMLVSGFAYAQTTEQSTYNNHDIIMKLQEIIESHAQQQTPNTLIEQKNMLEREIQSQAHYTSMAIGCALSIIFLVKLTPSPQSPLEFLWKALLFQIEVAIGSFLLGIAMQPIFEFILMTLCTDKNRALRPINFYHDVLVEFIRLWPNVRSFASAAIQEQCDNLYCNYINNGAHLAISDETAKEIIELLLTHLMETPAQLPEAHAA